MAAEWDEVKRLAADFQRAQLSSTVQRLSERNCVEIVSKLIEKGLLEVFFTTDGKEYVTPQHLIQEIKDELFVQGGRIHLAELAHILCLDYNHVEAKANELARSVKTVYLVLGQLIERDYVNRLFEEINEKLQQSGQMTIGELAKQYDLPPDFLLQMLRERLGSIVQGQSDPVDPHVVFTQAFVARHKARIGGALRAATRPTQISSICGRHQLQERLVFAILDELLTGGQLSGSVSGGRNEKTASYIPDVYAKAQNDWVDAFFKQNQYLEYDVLSRLGIGDPRGFIRKRFKAAALTFLDTCAIDEIIYDQFETGLEEAVATASWVDAATLCPSFFGDNDVRQVLQKALQSSKQLTQDTRIFCNTVLASGRFVQDLALPFRETMTAKAEQAGRKGIVWNSDASEPGKGGSTAGSKGGDAKKERKDDRRKKAVGGKSGGGTQGRETKTKSVKKKQQHGKGGKASEDEDEEEERPPARAGGDRIPFLTVDEIEEALRKQEATRGCPRQMTRELAESLVGPLRAKFQEVVRSVFLQNSAAGGSPRMSHAEIQDKINGLVANVRLFVKGIEQFAAEDLKTQLEKHLLKTICSDAANLVFAYASHEHMLTSDRETDWTSETRSKLLPKLPGDCGEALTGLNNSINGKSVEGFLEALETSLAPGICDMTIKKTDKKKERQLAFSHRHALSQQLSEVSEPALVLHLTTLVLFQTYTGCMIHASGKFVPQVLGFLDAHLSEEAQRTLHAFQGLVIKHLTSSDDDDDEQRASVKGQLDQMIPVVKEIAANAKKGSSADAPSN